MKNIDFSSDKTKLKARVAIDFWVNVGWGDEKDYSVQNIEEAINNTSFVLMAHNDDKLIALARVFSDGHIYTTLAEIAVLPEFRKQGIGKQMMKVVKDKYGQTGIYLEAFNENKEFFEKCGYIKRDNMMVYSKKFD